MLPMNQNWAKMLVSIYYDSLSENIYFSSSDTEDFIFSQEWQSCKL